MKKSFSNAAVIVIVGVLCAGILGGGFFVWQKKKQAQIQELQRQAENLQNSIQKEQDAKTAPEKNMEEVQKKSDEAGQKLPTSAPVAGEKCFLSGVAPVAAKPDPATWYLNRNMQTGYQYQIAGDMTLSRDTVREEDGIEVFTITTKEYPQGALLRAYDIRKRRYEHAGDEGAIISYDATSDLWHKAVAGKASATCAPDEFMKTAGKLPVYVIDPASGMRTYLVLAKIDPAKTGATAFLLEISLDIKDPNIPKGFLSNLEGLIQSIDRIGGAYPF